MRRIAVWACAAVIVATLAACGAGSTGAAVSIEALQAAAENTQSAGSYRFDLDATIRSGDKSVTITGTGSTSADGNATAARLEISGVGTIEYRMIDKVVYIDVGEFAPFTKELPTGKPWVKLDLDTLAGAPLGGLYDQAAGAGPNKGLELLEGLTGEPENLGDEQVNGARATHYRATLDYGKLGDAVEDDNVRRQVEQLGPVPVDVWIDDRDRVVKMHMKVDTGAFSGRELEKRSTVEVTITIDDTDGPVTVEAPPADAILDFSDWFGRSGTLI